MKHWMQSPTDYEWEFNSKGFANLALDFTAICPTDVVIFWHSIQKRFFGKKPKRRYKKIEDKHIRQQIEGKTRTLF
jgi:hypothetical protein